METRIQTALTKLRSSITAIHDLPSPISATAFNGEYSIAPLHRKDGTVCITVIIIPCINGIWKEFKQIRMGVPLLDREKAPAYIDAMSQCLEQEYALVPRNRDLTREHTKRRINGLIAEAIAHYPNEFSKTGDVDKKGFFTTSLELPSSSKQKNNIRLNIHIRPLSDYIERDSHYILTPIDFKINTYTRDKTKAQEIENWVHEYFQEGRFSNFNLRLAEHPCNREKEIPKAWIKHQYLRISQTSKGIYTIVLVEDRKRLPTISWSTGTRDLNIAKRKLAIIQDHLLPSYQSDGARENEPITLAAISRYMEDHCPEVDRDTPKEPHNDLRIITVNRIPKMKLPTPYVGPSSGSFICRLGFVPPNSTRNSKRTLDHPLNTSDHSFAETQARHLQTLTETVITEYFIKNPNISVTTEINKSVKKPEEAYKLPELGEQPPINQIFLRTLIDEYVKLAFQDFNRYIYWQPEIKKLANDRYEITCSVRRNENREVLPEGISVFQGPFILYAKDEETAKAFSHRLDDEIIRQQYFFSRERPVESFGQTSMNVAIRESLRTALREFPQIETPDTHAFQILTGRIR